MKRAAKFLEILILAAAVAAPAWLFYNWWQKVSAAKKAAVSQTSGPVSGVFSGAPVVDVVRPSTAPVSVSTEPAGPIITVSSAAASAAAVAAGAAPQAVSVQKAAVLSQTAAPSKAIASEAVSTNSHSGVSVPAQSMVYAPAVDKDPFLSPDDYEALREEAGKLEEERRRRLEEEAAKRRGEKPGEKPIWQRISLQGIMGKRAIVNDRVVNVGSSVLNARVVKITATTVTFDYKGQVFVKKLTP